MVADYTGSTNHSVDVSMRMSVNPGINPAVGYQFSVFTGKSAVQHRTLMMLSHYLECRQMVRNHHDMCSPTLFNAFPDKTNAGLKHPVEFFHLQHFPPSQNLIWRRSLIPFGWVIYPFIINL